MRWMLPWLSLALLLAGCHNPVIQGPQISDPPAGLGYDPNCRSTLPRLPGHELRRQRCWGRRSEPLDLIVVSELSAPLGREDAVAVRELRQQRFAAVEAGELERLRIDGRPAWGWLQSSRRRDGSLSARRYTAMTDHGQVGYLIDFRAESRLADDPELLRDAVLSFVVRQRGDFAPARFVGFALAGAMLWLGWTRVRRRERRGRGASR